MRRPTLRIAEIAQTQGISMIKLQLRTELAQQTIRWLWHDEPSHDVMLSTLQRVADVLNVQVAELLGPPREEPDGKK